MVSVGGWTCENGTPWNLDERLIAAAAAATDAPSRVVLFGRVIREPPSPESPSTHPSPPSPPSPVRTFGPLPPIASALVDKLEASGYDAERGAYIAGRTDKKPDELVCKIKIIREGGRNGRKRSRDEVEDPLEDKLLVVKFLDYVAVVPEQECTMPDGSIVPGIPAADLMHLVVGVLGDEASKKLKLGRTGDSEANLLVMPGLYEKGPCSEQKFNKIRKKKTTVRLEYKRRCDMCGEVPRKSGREINACGASVVMPDGKTIELYVCLGCPSGPMLVCGETVEVKKSLNSHSAHAKVVRAEAGVGS
jgi:hypothetical protein